MIRSTSFPPHGDPMDETGGVLIRSILYPPRWTQEVYKFIRWLYQLMHSATDPPGWKQEVFVGIVSSPVDARCVFDVCSSITIFYLDGCMGCIRCYPPRCNRGRIDVLDIR